MSKKLSKILVICAVIATFSLMIVGTAFAAYYSIDASVSVFVYVDSLSNASDAYAQVTFEGKQYKQNSLIEINGGHLNDVTLTAEGNGYEFLGWYAGNKESFMNNLQAGTVNYDAGTEDKITFGMTDHQNLVAHFAIKQKNVEWRYVADPTQPENLTTTAPTGYTNSFDYGDVLPTLSYSDIGWTFVGWQVNGEDTIYRTANADMFAKENVVLSAKWRETEKVSVTYKVNETVLETVDDIYVGSTYTLEDAKTLNTEAYQREKGYRYFWKSGTVNGEEFGNQVVLSGDLTVYLGKEIRVYDVNPVVQNSEVEYTGSRNLSFSVTDFTSLEALFNSNNYKTTYSFWTVTSTVQFGGTTYSTAEALKEAIIESSPYTSTTATVNILSTIEKKYSTFSLATAPTFQAGVETNWSYSVYDDAETDNIPNISNISNVSSALTLNEVLALGSVQKLYADVDSDGEREEVVIKYLVIGGIDYRVSGTDTINDIIEKYISKTHFSGETLTFDSWIIRCSVAD